ncbi:Tctex1 domain-containing protein 4 [Frankliniella fusca]|uniref:Tctex1 domain-containing protein 4 n=1 Tax=Frankliniella fusca TaxID=407009 RepID=A0AAE1GT69_9NEOP|nr:Tctex1 domain-containing protein 4 [Frankliniella fusca]
MSDSKRQPARAALRGTRGRGASREGKPAPAGSIRKTSQIRRGDSSFEVLDFPRVSEQTVASAYEVLADSPPRRNTPSLQSAYEVFADDVPQPPPAAPGEGSRPRAREGSRSSSQGFSRDSADTVIRVGEPSSHQPQRPGGGGAGGPGGHRPPEGSSAAAVGGGGGAGAAPRGASAGPPRQGPSAVHLRVESAEPLHHAAVRQADTAPATALEVPPPPPPPHPSTTATAEDLAGLLRLSLSHGPPRERSFLAGLSATGSFARPESRETVSTTLSDRAVYTTGLAGFLSAANAGSRTPSSASQQSAVSRSVSSARLDKGTSPSPGTGNAGGENLVADSAVPWGGVAGREEVGRATSFQKPTGQGGQDQGPVRQRGTVRIDIGHDGAASPKSSGLNIVGQNSRVREEVTDGEENARQSMTGRSVTDQERVGERGGAGAGGARADQDHADQEGLGRTSALSVTSRSTLTEAAAIPSTAAHDPDTSRSTSGLGGHGDAADRPPPAAGAAAAVAPLVSAMGAARLGREGLTSRRAAAASAAAPEQTAQVAPAGDAARERTGQDGGRLLSEAKDLSARGGSGKDDRSQSGAKIRSASASGLAMGMGDSPAPAAAPVSATPAETEVLRSPAVPGPVLGPGAGDRPASSLAQHAAPSLSASVSRSASPTAPASARVRGGLRPALEAPGKQQVDQVIVREGKAIVVQPPQPSEPQDPDEERQGQGQGQGQGRAGLRRSRSAVFSIKRPPPANPAGPAQRIDPDLKRLIQHIDTVLPKGVQKLLMQLENHPDLGVMALHAAALHRHRRLSSALRELQELQAQAQEQARRRPAEKAPKTTQPQPARARWRRGLLFRMTVKPSTPPPPPPLPPTQRPDMLDLERSLLDALRLGLGVEEHGSGGSPDGHVGYAEAWAPDACRILAAHVARVASKLQQLQRYKLACVVRIIQKKQQRLCCHLAALWDSQCDGYCSVVYETDTLVAHGLLMIVYWD